MTDRALNRILYVDDEADIREIVSMALSLTPTWTVRTCASGLHALEELPTYRPDLVLLDVMMPGLDGPATLARMRTDPQWHDVPVVFITAKALPQEIERFTQLGAVGVISKPFDPLKLGRQVQDMWAAAP